MYASIRFMFNALRRRQAFKCAIVLNFACQQTHREETGQDKFYWTFRVLVLDGKHIKVCAYEKKWLTIKVNQTRLFVMNYRCMRLLMRMRSKTDNVQWRNTSTMRCCYFMEPKAGLELRCFTIPPEMWTPAKWSFLMQTKG